MDKSEFVELKSYRGFKVYHAIRIYKHGTKYGFYAACDKPKNFIFKEFSTKKMLDQILDTIYKIESRDKINCKRCLCCIDRLIE